MATWTSGSIDIFRLSRVCIYSRATTVAGSSSSIRAIAPPPPPEALDKNIFDVLCLAFQSMAIFQIYRMKEAARHSFRSAAHTAGLAQVKPRDYEKQGQAEGNSAYGVWTALQGTADALEVGDVLEAPDGTLRICKYVGFEEARWVLPEVKSGVEGFPGAAGVPPPPDQSTVTA